MTYTPEQLHEDGHFGTREEMSLVERLRESYISTGQNYVQEAADRIDALEECLRNIAYAKPSAWEPDVRDQFQEWAQNKARALLEGK